MFSKKNYFLFTAQCYELIIKFTIILNQI